MTADALLVVQTLFSTIWRLFTSWNIPGTNTTPAAFILFLSFAVLGLRFLKSLVLLGSSSGDPTGPGSLTGKGTFRIR